MDLVVAGGNYSYTANSEYHGNDLTLPYTEACQHIAAAGFTHTYLVPFRAADFPGTALQPDTGMTLGGLPFGSSTLIPGARACIASSLPPD